MIKVAMMIIVPNISGTIGTMIKDSGSHFSSTNMFDLKIHFRINDQEIYIVRKHEKNRPNYGACQL
ncbi:hypothetical protein C1O25_00720 [Vibrio diazotrophicus]|uniref:Uncharacterized protein n=2 Tax=Vibrio diazotrophicus TaxID=685 RepID=A0ABX4WFI5_VIBDI|nr:hypothetical protein C1M59_04175 [Vibrio diazotrophicus]PNH98691.1 hypothetical protein C1O24_01230 [Vibrio diazotrophicus]PNI03614.1 hypothetical protein C1O25_00720 [Vibrio diazotrophicus]